MIKSILSLICIFSSVYAYAQEEGIPVEDPLQENPLADEDEILNQLERLNKFSDMNINFKSFIYSERGRRNPFKKPAGLEREIETSGLGAETTGLEGYDISSFQLTAVMWDIKYPKALVKASEDEVYVIEEGTKIGRRNGYVAKIREGEIVVIESSTESNKKEQTLYKTQVLKLRR